MALQLVEARERIRRRGIAQRHVEPQRARIFARAPVARAAQTPPRLTEMAVRASGPGEIIRVAVIRQPCCALQDAGKFEAAFSSCRRCAASTVNVPYESGRRRGMLAPARSDSSRPG